MKTSFYNQVNSLQNSSANFQEQLTMLNKYMESFNKAQFLEMFQYLDNEEENIANLYNLITKIKSDFKYAKVSLGAKANFIMEEKDITLA